MKTRSTETPAADPQAIHNGFSLISNQKLLQLYVTMVKCRLLEDRMSQLAQEGKISGSRAASGQEASAVGLLLDLLADDAVSPAPNDVIARFIKGESLERILDQILGKALGKPGVVAAGVMPAAPSDAIRLSIATGAALDAKMQGGNRLVAALCGDGSTAPELWYEVLSFAGAHKLPILFLCQHSLGSDEIELKVSGCGVP